MTPLVLKTIVIPLAVAALTVTVFCLPRHHSLAGYRRRCSILRALAAGIVHR